MITEAMITKYGLASRKATLLEGIKKKLKEKILEGLEAGDTIPLTGPYTIDLSPNGGKELDMKVEWIKLRVRYLRLKKYSQKEAEAIAEKDLKDLYENAPEKKAVTVAGKEYVGGVKFTPKVNAKYKKPAALEAEEEAVA